MTNKTPQWENRFRRKFVSNGYVSMEDGDLFEAKEVKAFIKSTLEAERTRLKNAADLEKFAEMLKTAMVPLEELQKNLKI